MGPKDLSEFRIEVFVIFAVLAVGFKKKKKKKTKKKTTTTFMSLMMPSYLGFAACPVVD